MHKRVDKTVVENKETLVKKYKCLPTILFIILGVSFIGLIAYIIIFRFIVPGNTSLTLSPPTTKQITVTPTIVPIFQGRGTYNISQGKTNGPKISKAIIDPHDPQKGTIQNFTVYVKHTSPVAWVKVTLKSDNEQVNVHNLSLTEGTKLEGQWTGSWVINNTHLQNYVFVINAGDGTYESRAGIAIR